MLKAQSSHSHKLCALLWWHHLNYRAVIFFFLGKSKCKACSLINNNASTGVWIAAAFEGGILQTRQRHAIKHDLDICLALLRSVMDWMELWWKHRLRTRHGAAQQMEKCVSRSMALRMDLSESSSADWRLSKSSLPFATCQSV